MATNSINSIKTRIIHKHDTEANWGKAENFIPLQGEIIIYDKDSTHTYERIKIGDGSTKVNALPFIDAPDDALSETSSNTVKNSAIYAALETKVTRNTDTEDFTTSIKNTINANSAKLAGIAEGAQVNQKAFSTIAVKTSSTATATNIDADTTTDTLTLIAGNNITLTPAASSDQITISAKDTTYSNATASKAGLMSSADKGDLTAAVAKLANIEEGAQVNQNAFSTIAVKASSSATAQNITADSTKDTLTLIAGSNITLTPSTSSDQITISATDTKLALDTNLTSSGKAADAKAVGDKIAELVADIGTIDGDFDAFKVQVNTLLNSDDETLDQTKEIVTYIKNNKSLIDGITTSKQNTITGGATTITSSNLTKDRALISNSSGKVAVSPVTSTELGYLDGVTSGIQGQLNAKASSDDLAALGDSVFQENYNLARKGIKIEANTDLDSLTTPGHYYSPDGNSAGTLLNCPTPTTGFRLLVSSTYGDGGATSNYMRQIIFNSGSSKIFTRLKNYNGAWQSWQTIITSANPGDFLDNIDQDDFWDAIVAPGGKITGSFYLGNSATAPKIYFKPTNFNDEVMGSIQYNAEADSTRSRYQFLQYSRSSSDYSKVAFYEAYSLPSVDPDRTEHGGYSILTSKNKVTLAQGGTGANLSDIPAGAVVRNSSNDTGLWYTPTQKGAFYASAENGLPSFGILPVGMGGTGTATAPTKGGVIYASSTSAYASTAAGSTGQVLISNGANAPSWTSQANLSVGSATTATKLSTTTAGSSTLPVYFSGGKPVAVSSVRIGSSTAGTYTDFLVSRKNSADAAYAQGYMAITSSSQNLQIGYTHFSADGTKDSEVSLYFNKGALRHSISTSTSTDDAPTLGISSNKWKAVYADKFIGTADKAEQADQATQANKIPVTDTEPTTEQDYFVTFVGNKTANTYYPPRANNGLMYRTLNGTTTTAGLARLYLGNSKSSTTEGNKKGDIVLYSTGTKYIRITPADTSGSNYVFTLPAKTGTAALTSDLPTISTGRAANGYLTISLGGTDYVARSPYVECYGTILDENTDLNTIKTPGIRYSSGSDRSTTLVNTPLKTSGFRLFTHSGYGGSGSSYSMQEIIGSQQRFWRTMGNNNSSPTDWWVIPRIKANTQVGSSELPVYISEAGMVYAISKLNLPGTLTATDITATGTLTVTGTSTFNTTAYLKGNTYAYNRIYFRNDASDINSINGFGAYSSGRGGAVANSNYLIVDSEGNYACRWQLRAYSIDSSTGQALTKSQYYVFPNTPTDLTSDILATVITNKNPNDLLSSSLSQTSFWNAIVAKGGFMTGILSLKNSEQYPQLHFQPSFSSTPIFKIYGSAGSATAFKQGAYAWFRLYSFTDGATSTSSYYEDYRLPSVDVGLTGTKGYNILTSKPLSTNILYRKYDKDTSSAGNAITWYKSNGTTIQHMLGAHNTGNTHGAVYIIPYTPTSGVDTWSGTEGLYIGKTKFTWESKTIYHTGNIVTCSNTSEITSPTEGMIALIVS